MATTTASKKAKGRKLQQEIVKLVLETFPFLHEEDIKSAPMGTNGEDVVLSHAAAEWFPFSVEAKNTERLDIWKALAQAESENRGKIPVVVFKRNRTNPYLVISLQQFLLILDKMREALAVIGERTGTECQTIKSVLNIGVKP
jgi:hypothetical protein